MTNIAIKAFSTLSKNKKKHRATKRRTYRKPRNRYPMLPYQLMQHELGTIYQMYRMRTRKHAKFDARKYTINLLLVIKKHEPYSTYYMTDKYRNYR